MTTYFGLPEDTWLLLDRYGILLGDIMLTFSISLMILAFIKRNTLKNFFQRNTFPRVGHELLSAHQYDTVIFTVSRPEIPLWLIRQYKIKTIGLIASKESLEQANYIMATAVNESVKAYPIAIIEDANDVAQTKEACHRLIHQLKSDVDRRLAVDITGGKTTMSLGAFMAAEELRIDTIYVSSEFDSALKKPMMNTARIYCISQPASINK